MHYMDNEGYQRNVRENVYQNGYQTNNSFAARGEMMPQDNFMPQNEMQQPQQKQKRPHFFLFLITVILGLFCGIGVSFISGSVSGIVFGIATIIGAFFFALDIPKQKSESKFVAGLIGWVGVEFIIMSILSMIMPDKFYGLTGVAAIVTGLLIIITPSIFTSLKKRRCCESVRAVCIGLSASTFHHKKHSHKEAYAPIWQYTVGGRAYTNAETVFSTPPEFRAGEGTELMVNPNDPNEFTRGKNSGRMIAWIWGIIVILIGIPGVISLFTNII